MNIASHPIPGRAEACLYAMRLALTIAHEHELTPKPNFADAFGMVAANALEAAIDIDAGAI